MVENTPLTILIGVVLNLQKEKSESNMELEGCINYQPSRDEDKAGN